MIRDRSGDELSVRCITLKLNQPTEDGDTEIVLLTNLPSEIAAETIAEAYRQRWTIEHAFLELTLSLHGKIATLMYPPAALLACASALVTYNVMSVVKSPIARVQNLPRRQETRDNLSMYYLASEVAVVSQGMQIAIPSHEWHLHYSELSAEQMAEALKNHARHVRLARYRKDRRGPKPPRPNAQVVTHTSRLPGCWPHVRGANDSFKELVRRPYLNSEERTSFGGAKARG